jgi:hypothetical protein
MPSIVWNRDLQEAYHNPYEYKAQDQFTREAKKILEELFSELLKYSMKFKIDDTSIKKAVWMLQIDAVDSLRDCLMLIKKNNHRVAGRLFRDVMETLDLAAFFSVNTMKSNKELKKWYNDEVIPHGEYRNFIKKTEGEEKFKNVREEHRMLSKMTHRTYRTLAYGYVLGRNNFLAYEGNSKKLLVPPETISMYYALLAYFILVTSNEIGKRGLVQKSVIKNIWRDSLEVKTVPRRFVQRPY